MKITNLKIENFGSFETAEYSFEDGVTALVGQNLTDEGQGSNGSGKSTIQQAAFYALTGNNLRCSLDKKLIRKGADKAIVRLDIFCSKRNETLSIQRELPMKGSAKLSILINNKAVSFATYKDGNDFIVNWLQISNDDLKSYFFVCKEYYKSFFRASNTEKLALISRFINFSFLDKAKDIIQEKLSVLNEEKRVLQSSFDKIEGQISAYEEQLIQEEQKDVEQIKEEKKQVFRNKIKIFEEGIQENLKKVSDVQIKKSEINRDLKKLNLKYEILQEEFKSLEKTDEYEEQYNEICKEIDNLNSEKKEVEKDLDIYKNDKTKLESALRRIAVNLSGVIECPKCHHKFLTLENTTLEEEIEKQKKWEKKLEKQKQSIEKQIKVVDEYQEAFKELKQLRDEVNDQINEVINLRKNKQKELDSIYNSINNESKNLSNCDLEIERIQNKSELLKEQIDQCRKSIEAVDKEKFMIDTTSIEKKLESLQEEYETKEKEIKNIDEKIFKQTEWIGRFKSFKMYLAAEQIKNIQNFTNEILEKENSDLRLVIEAFKVDSKGNAKEEITPYVLRDDLESYWYYSGGERARVEIALILAIQQMINLTNPYGGLQFLSIDEITEGLSEEGLYDIIEALDFVRYPVLITTHIFNQNAKCRLLRVVKENGISRIKE